MSFFKHLFSPVQKPVVTALQGVAPEETLAAQTTMRQHMEADVAADRARRGATDVRPGGGRPSTRNLAREFPEGVPTWEDEGGSVAVGEDGRRETAEAVGTSGSKEEASWGQG